MPTQSTEQELPQPQPQQIALDGVAGQIESILDRLSRIETEREAAEGSQEFILRQALIDEITQRGQIRQAVLLVAVTVLVLMFIVLAHLTHEVFFGPIVMARSTVAVAAIVAPIACITTVSVMLMIGAYRGFKDNDTKIDTAALLEAAKAGLNGN